MNGEPSPDRVETPGCPRHSGFKLGEPSCERCGRFRCLMCLVECGLQANCVDCGAAPKFSAAATMAARGKRKIGVVVFLIGATTLFFLLLSWPAAIASSAALAGTSSFTVLHSMYGAAAVVSIVACLLSGRLFRSTSLEVYRDDLSHEGFLRLRAAVTSLLPDLDLRDLAEQSPALERQRTLLSRAKAELEAQCSGLDSPLTQVLQTVSRLEAEARRGLRLGSTLD